MTFDVRPDQIIPGMVSLPGTDAIAAEINRAVTSGGSAQKQIARMRAFCIARYKLTAVTGRPEELAESKTDRRVSFGYGSKTIRCRWQQGRTWLGYHDFQLVDDGWSPKLAELLDAHIRFISPAMFAPTN